MGHFSGASTWDGGHYELGIELGGHSDERLCSALQALWKYPALRGPYAHDDVEPEEQTIVAVATSSLQSKLFGIAAIRGLGTAACLTVPIRYEDGTDWLYFCFPLGSLGEVLPIGGFPMSAPGTWLVTVEDWLAELGRHVFEHLPFPGAVIGFETEAVGTLEEARKTGRSESFLVRQGNGIAFQRRG